jgi:hypothetical protein
MFQASLRPSWGEHNCGHCLWFSVLVVAVVVPERMLPYWVTQHPLHSAHISLPDSPEPQRLKPRQKTTGSNTQLCSPDDGCKDAWNVSRNNWLPINHYLLHLVGLAFICLYKMHGHSNTKFQYLHHAMWISSSRDGELSLLFWKNGNAFLYTSFCCFQGFIKTDLKFIYILHFQVGYYKIF